MLSFIKCVDRSKKRSFSSLCNDIWQFERTFITLGVVRGSWSAITRLETLLISTSEVQDCCTEKCLARPRIQTEIIQQVTILIAD